MPIRHWSPDDRPRERLRRRGPGALSNRELLAILVGSGGRSRSALDVADGLLKGCRGSLRVLSSLDTLQMETLEGVGPAIAARVQASIELGRRSAAHQADDRGETVRGPEDVFHRLGPRLRDLAQEEFHVLVLDVRHRVVREVLVTRGTLDASLIHPREVFRPAILERGAGIILAHNHPSGDPSPSEEDRAVTRQLASAGRAIGIPVLDHVIIGDGQYTSLSELDAMGSGVRASPGAILPPP